MSLKQTWARTSAAVLAAFVRQPQKERYRAWAIIGGFVMVIGVIDFLSGIEVSLALLYLIPVSLATGWFGGAMGVTVALGCTLARLASDWASIWPDPLPWHTWWNVSASLVIFMFAIWAFNSLLGLHRHLEGEVLARTLELREAASERQRLEREILDVGARERGAIGRELHDELGQHLVATAFAAQVMAETLGDAPTAGKARAIVGWIEEGIAKTRKLARGLLTEHIEPTRLAQELEELAVASSRSGISCAVRAEGAAISADASECAQLFRIAQEAVANALRHSHGSCVEISLVHDAEAALLAISDNGVGLPRNADAAAGMGLRIMAHRATVIGATFSVGSHPGPGTTVSCRLPRKRTEAA